jgi:hypothetical protein
MKFSIDDKVGQHELLILLQELRVLLHAFPSSLVPEEVAQPIDKYFLFLQDIYYLNQNLALFTTQIENKNNRNQYSSAKDYKKKITGSRSNLVMNLNCSI